MTLAIFDKGPLNAHLHIRGPFPFDLRVNSHPQAAECIKTAGKVQGLML